MRLRFCLMAVLCVLAFTVPVLAQDGATDAPVAGSGGLKDFFYSEDLLGQIIIGVLLLASACSIAFAIRLFMVVRRGSIVPDDTADQIEQMLAEKRYKEAMQFAEEDSSFLGKLVNAALAEAGAGFSAMERAVEEAGDAETSRILRPLEYLNVVGNIAPMLGLFGTVYGMIIAFQELVAAGGKAEPTELAAGISTALVTTFWGLVVAMPALAFYALIRNKVDALTSEGMLVAEELIRPFKPGKSKSGGSSSSRPRATPNPEKTDG